MTNKITKIEMFTAIRNALTDPAQISFVNHEIELLQNKKSTKTLSATQKANLDVKKQILATLSDVTPMTIGELQEANENLASYTNQKLSALLSQLVKDNLIERVNEKRVTRFILIKKEEE